MSDDRIRMNVQNIVERDDGSAIITFDLSAEAIIALAKVGILRLLTEAAQNTIAEEAERVMKETEDE